MAVDVADAVKDLIEKILGNRETALQYARDPEGTIAAQGITEGDTSNLDMFQTVSDVCGTMPGFQNYGTGGGASGGGASGGMQPPPPSATGQSVDQIMQHLNYVTYVAYEGDELIQQEITNIDQSQNVDVNVGGDFDGDITVDSHDINANATGDGSAASGLGPATAGDENLVNTGVNLGQQNTGDQAAQGIALGGDVVQNTGEFTGIQAGGDVTATGSVLSFGEGDATQQIGNVVGPGGALAGSGDASGHFEDNDTTLTNVGNTTETNVQTVTNSEDVTLQQEQGPGDATQDTGFDLPDRVLEPVRLTEEGGGEESGDSPDPMLT